MTLVEEIDAYARELLIAPDQNYEIGAMVAVSARDAASEEPSSPGFARSLSLIFGTLVERIHANVGRFDLSVAADRDIARALEDWRAGGRADIGAFVERWTSRVGELEAPWLEDRGTPLTARGGVRSLVDRFRFRRSHEGRPDGDRS